MKPVLFIITGSNGAGKSTVGVTYLPAEIQKKYSVFDGDKLALRMWRERNPSNERIFHLLQPASQPSNIALIKLADVSSIGVSGKITLNP